MSKISGGGGSVTKVTIIHQIDKFFLKKRAKNGYEGTRINLGRGPETLHPLDPIVKDGTKRKVKSLNWQGRGHNKSLEENKTFLKGSEAGSCPGFFWGEGVQNKFFSRGLQKK